MTALLRTTIALALAASLAPVVRADDHGRHAGRAKHVLLFIGDGMQLEHEIATSRYLFGRDAALSFHGLEYRGNVATWDVTTYDRYAAAQGAPPYAPTAFVPTIGYDPARGGKKPYPLQTAIDDGYFSQGGRWPATDSASSGTAWATGFKTDDGNIAWLPGDPQGGSLRTVAEILRAERGFAIGVVSTVPFTHATPAVHVSHNPKRSSYHAIADEILRVVKPEVVIGGGFPHYKAPADYGYVSQASIDAAVADPEWLVIQRQAGVDGRATLLAGAQEAARSGKRLFGLFGGPGGSFESPVPFDFPGTPLVLQGSLENPLLADATLAALNVLSRDPDGFFVMIEQGDIDWANHANDFARMVGTTWDLHQAVQAAIDFVDRPGDDIDWSNTLLVSTADHANGYLRNRVVLGAGDLPHQTIAAYPNGEVTYGTGSHTNELVRLYARGAGTSLLRAAEGDWYPCTRIIDNTQLFHVLTAAAGAPQRTGLAPVKRDAGCRDHDQR